MYNRGIRIPFLHLGGGLGVMAATISILLVFVMFQLPSYAATAIIGDVAFSVWPDTGQNKCYDPDGNEITCPSQGEDFYGQDAQYNGPTRRYTKLDYINGHLMELPDNATSWTMVRDNVTGLIWEVKTNKDEEENYDDPHDADNVYTRCSDYEEHHTEEFIAALNAQHFGGFFDWRLPTIKELSTLVDASIPWSGPTINTNYFPNTVGSSYWSYNGWGVHFAWGDPHIMYCVEYPYYSVRAVRGNFVHGNIFTDNNDGTITDRETGLMWQKCSMGQSYNPSTGGCEGDPQEYTWREALSACENLTLAGHEGWRLPNRNELLSIVDYFSSERAINLFYFPNTLPSDYWSSTTMSSSTKNKWAVNFDTGELESGGAEHYIDGTWYGTYVRCVRSGHTGTFYDLSISVTGSGTGIVSSTVQSVDSIWNRNCQDSLCVWPYPLGTEVTLHATPDDGFQFNGWTGACEGCGTDQECTITMNKDKTCSATFDEISNEPPVIESFTIEPDSGTAPLSVTVICQAQDLDGTVSLYEFDPGDGGEILASENGTFSYTYETPGTYQAICKVYNEKEAETTSEHITVTVEEASITWNDISESISYTHSRTLFDRLHRAFFVLIDITNNTGIDFAGPVRMVLESSTLPLKTGISGLDPDGYTEDGKPYFIIVPEEETWTAGETLKDLRLNFELQRKRLSFTLRFEQLGPQPM